MEEIKEKLYAELQKLHEDIAVLNNNIMVLEFGIESAKTPEELKELLEKTNIEEGLEIILLR